MATDSKQHIELECQQVQEQLLKLTADREMLQKEFERITSCGQHLLQQIQDDRSQASETRKSKYEMEKEKLEEKLKALEVGIVDKDERIEFLDTKASDYLLQVSTFSNSLFDSSDTNISEDVATEGECSGTVKDEEVAKVLESIVADENVQCSDDDNTSEQELEPTNIVAYDSEPVDTNSDHEIINKVSNNRVNLNVEVKTVINLVMEEVPVVDKVSSEGVGMSEACNKAILATNQVIENIQEKIEKNESSDVLVSGKETEQPEETAEDDIDLDGEGTTDVEENGNEVDVIIDTVSPVGETSQKNEIEVELVKREIVDDQSSVQPHISDVENALPDSTVLDKVETVDLGSPIADKAGVTSPNDEAGKQSSGSGSPVREQMMSLSLLVAELRRVKDDMGKCMSVKEKTFIELEDQLQSANKEVSSLKVSMSRMSKNLEEKEQSYQALEEENIKKKMDIELKMKDVQDVTNKCSMLSEEKGDILRKMEVLEIMMTEYRTEIEMLVSEKTKLEQDTKELLSAKAAASVAEAEIDSRTNVEEKEKEIEELVEKIQSMEKQMKELNDKLKVTNKHLKVMAREREHKQKECEILKRKVELVELKMCELQGTFDMLVKAVMVERDELIKEMEEKNGHIDDVHRTLAQLKDTHEQELEKVMHEKKALDEELCKYKLGELKPVFMLEQTQLDAITHEKEKLAHDLKQQTEHKDALEGKLKSVQVEMNDFVSVLKEEMSRLKDETEKTKLEKKCMEETFASLQADHLEMASKHQSMEKLFQELEQSNKEKTANLEVLKLQLDDLQQQLEDLNTKNFNLSSEMYSKEEEFREELSAREGTIQELNVTLTNNQKQSMENYNALQEDLASLQTKFKTSTEENKKQIKEMEDKLKQSLDDKKKEVTELQDKVKSLIEELKEAKTDMTGSQTSCYQECESPSVSQEGELQSSSLAVAPSLPLDTATDSLSTSSSLRMEAEGREVENKAQLLEAQKKKGKELEKLLEVTAKKLEAKEAEMHTLVESNIPQLNEKIKQLTGELEEFRKSPAAGETFKTQAEFEVVIGKKEEKIQELESKVGDLELSLVNKNGYISQLEGRLEEGSEVKNDVESNLEQIRKLSADISKLKDELKETHEQCEVLRHTVVQLESDRQGIEQEKAKAVEEYESKLKHVRSKVEEVRSDLEEKKNSVERLEFELRNSRSSHVEVVASLESNHIDRVAEVVKLHRRKADEIKSSNSTKISELHDHIDELYKAKKSLESQISSLQREYEGEISQLEERWAEEKKEKEYYLKKVKMLEKEKIQLEDETGKLKNGFEKEQMMSADMQDQMVSDLEKLILGLESEKKNMEKEISQLKSLRDLQSSIILDNEKKISLLSDEIIIANKENSILKDEVKNLKGVLGEDTVLKYNEDHGKSKTIEELTEKVKVLKSRVDETNANMQEQEDIYAHKLKEEKDDHIMQLRALRKELAEEVDDIELKRKQLSLEYEDKIALMAADYQDNLKETIKRYETRLAEEKAEFGRVLIIKIDEYERKLAMQSTDENSYESQINALQAELEDKSSTIEELEQNLDEMTLIKAALRAQVDDLKLTVTKIGEGSEKLSIEVLHSEYESRLTEIQEHYEGQLMYLRSVLQGVDIEVQTEGPNEAQGECCSSPSLCSEYSMELSCLRPYLQGQSSPVTDLMAEHRCQSSHGSEVDPSDHSFHFLARSASGAKSKEDGKVGITLAGLSAHLLAKSFPKGNSEYLSNGALTYTLTKSSSKSEVKSKLANFSVPLNFNNNPKLQKDVYQGTSIDAAGHARMSVPSLKFPEGISTANSTSSSLNPDTLVSSATGAKPRPPRRNVSKPQSSPAIEFQAASKEGTESTNRHSIPQPSDTNPESTAAPDKYRVKTEMSACCVVQ